MNNEYLERAKEIIVDPLVLSIVAARRARQIAMGARPMVKCDSENHLDIALLEIAEGKLDCEPGDPNAKPEDVLQMLRKDQAEDTAEAKKPAK